MTMEEYERRAKEIDAWAEQKYREGEMGESAIERRVAAMFDALDAKLRRAECERDFNL